MNEDMTEQQAQDMLRQMAEDKKTIYSIFGKIINKSQSTTKVGNLNTEELGTSKLPLRTYLELSLFCEDIADDKVFAKYFTDMAEIQTASSLSKDGFLINRLITSKKELADVSPKSGKKNGEWFKKGGEAPAQ